MKTLRPLISWSLHDHSSHPLDPRVLELVAGIRTAGSLAAAAEDLRIPYRTAWALLEHAEAQLGRSLVKRERGRGARPTPLGEKLLEADAQARRAWADQAKALEVAIGPDRQPRLAQPLRIAASHDLVLAQLRDGWRQRERIAIAFHGSTESIALFAQGRVDLAGFHAPAPHWNRAPLLAALSPDRDVLFRFLRRTQGLILARGNPHGAATLRDVARQKLRFVNRQPGSGTRLLVDTLLREERVSPASIAGYANEEFTHAAVAATIAAGNADAGIGIAAAAAQLGLAFVPLVEERYGFACRRAALESTPVAAFRALLASGRVRAVVSPLPGYALDEPGAVVELG